MKWEIFPAGNFSQYASMWDALQRSVAPVPILESRFLQALLDEFGSGREVLAICRRDERWCAAAIFLPPHFGVWRIFQPAQLPLGAWISSAEIGLHEYCQSLIRALPGIAVGAAITRLDPLFLPRPANGPRLKTANYIETAWVDLNQSFESYWEARGKNLRANVRKQRAKLESEEMSLDLECLTDTASVAGAIEDYGGLESSGWKGKEGSAVCSQNSQGRFYRRLLEQFCAVGRGSIYRYRIGGKVVAMDLCIEAGDRIVILKIAYDESYKTVSPSTLLRHEEFQTWFREGRLKRVEFYGPLMEWHTRWTECRRCLFNLTAYRWNWLAQMHALRLRLIRVNGG